MVQAFFTGKSYKHNSVQPLVHRDCNQLPKPHMEALCSFSMPHDKELMSMEVALVLEGYGILRSLDCKALMK
jgi:hypothetical protein